MIKKEKLIDSLKSIGFNEYKARVFCVLASGKILSASEIAEEADIVRGSIYDILKGFVENGYCNEIETNRVLQYQIIDPDVIVDKIIKEYHEDLHTNVSRVRETFEALKSLYKTENGSVDKHINIELIRGYNKHRIAKYIEMIRTAKSEILGMYRFKGLVMDESNEIAEKFISAGGTLKSIYQVNLDFKIAKGKSIKDATIEDLISVCEGFTQKGEDVRLTDLEIPNITVIDKENVFINVDDKWIPKQSQADIILRHTNLAKNMTDLFNYYWNNSYTIEEFKIKVKNQAIYI